jgi:phage virion morphogenesis protein
MGGVKINLDSAVSLRSAMDFLQLDTLALHKDVGEYLLQTTQDRFRDQKGPDGKAWTPLAESTRARKQKLGRSPKILTELHDLRSSYSYAATKESVEVGSNLVYSRIHQLGGQAGKGKRVTLPARPALGLSSDDNDEIQTLLIEHIEAALKARL